MFFDSWTGLLRVVVVGTLAYTSLVVLLRVSGKRTLSKLNAFDLIITVALGSTLATIILSKDVALLEGILGFTFLVSAQYVVTAASVRSRAVRELVKSQPRLLAYRGELIAAALREERVTQDEVLSALREHGFADIDETGAVVLETDGSMTVLSAQAAGGAALRSVAGIERAEVQA